MAQSGNWFMNVLNWYIGYIIAYFWMYIGQILSLFTLWQMPHDGVAQAFEQFKPVDLSTSMYTTSMTLG